MSVFFIGAIIGAVIIAIVTFPLLYQHLFLLIPGVAKYSAGDVLNRYILLIIMGTVWWTYFRLQLRTIRMGKLTSKRLRIAALALASGCLLIAMYFMTKLFLGHVYIDIAGLARAGVIKTILWYLLGAITVGIIEETLFRGVVLEVFLQDSRAAYVATLLSAVVFAAVHFIDFSYIAELMLGMSPAGGDFWSVDNLAKFLLLAAVGVLLAYARIRTNTLYAAIGLHAGFVFSLRLSGKIFKANPGQSAQIFQPSGADGYIMTGVLALAVLFAHLLPRENNIRLGGVGRNRY